MQIGSTFLQRRLWRLFPKVESGTRKLCEKRDAYSLSNQARHILESGKGAFGMEKEFRNGQMAQNMMANGHIIKPMARVPLRIAVGFNILVIGRMIRLMGLAYILI